MEDISSVRISLVCGSLEPHKDGVGDYCRTLAASLRQCGAHVTLIGLNDKYVEDDVYADSEILRLPATWPTRRRFATAAEAIEHWAPNWISLQFVNWNFGWKGIVTTQTKMLRRLTRGRSLHIMFHETWVGGALEIIPPGIAQLRRRILGQLQKATFQSMAKGLPHQLAHVSNAAYQRHLTGIGVKTLQMPMFGSVEPSPPDTWLRARLLLKEVTGFSFPESRSDLVLIGTFGAVRPCPVIAALQTFVAVAQGKKQVVLLTLGAIGHFGEQLLSSWRKQVPGLQIVTTGPLSTATLSAFFQHLDAAISLHPAETIGRSSAAAALLEHGVPVICPWGELPSVEDKFMARWQNLLFSHSQIAMVMSNPTEKLQRRDCAMEAAKQLLSDMDTCGASKTDRLSDQH